MIDYLSSFVNTDGVAFPNTAAKNATSPGATDGTEFVKLLIDDAWGARQDLMNEAGLVPDGLPEAAGTSQYLEALIKVLTSSDMISGLILSNNTTDPTKDVDISPGKALNVDGTVYMNLPSTFVKQLDAIWAVGTGAGGLFSGAVAASTWYAVHLIKKDSDGSIDAGFDTSATAVNIPAGYTSYRRIGWVLTDSLANIIAFSDYELSGGSVKRKWLTYIEDFAGAVSTRQLVTLSVPIEAVASIYARCNNTSSSHSTFREVQYPDVLPSVSDYDVHCEANAQWQEVNIELLVDANRQIALRSAAATTTGVVTLGYTDRRVS